MGDSIRDALTLAYAKTSEDSDPAEETPVSEVSSTPVVDDADTASDDLEGTQEPTETPPLLGSSPDQAPGQASPAQDATPVATPDPAPASWKVEEKAAWAALPPAAKAAIKRREADTLRALNTSAEARRTHDTMHKALQPYASLLQKHNVKDPVAEVVGPVLEIRRVLEEGTPEQKALMAYNIIKNYGIDVQKVDDMLVDGPRNVQAPTPPPAPLDPWSIPAFAPLKEIVEGIAARKEAQVEGMIAEISGLPNFEELREDIGEVLQRFAANKIPITMKAAYDRARLLRPDIAPLDVAPAPTAGITKSQAAAILASRNASSSVKGAPRSEPKKKGGSLRDDLMASMEDATV